MKKVNIGVIGTGRIGRIHARNLKFHVSGAQLVGLSDVAVEAAQNLAYELEVPIVEKDYHRLLASKDIDAVVICSSTETHAQIIMEAARAGKDIFCEKPIALEMEKINQALDSVDRAGLKLQLGFNRRFDPSFKKARELVEIGKVGVPQLLRISSRDPQPPPLEYVRTSGGLFLDMMIHDFDMARYLMRDEVAELMATGNCLIDPSIGKCGDVDTAVVLLKFRNGALGSIDNSRQAVYGYDQRVEVFGSLGSVVVENKTPTEVTLHTADAIQSDKPLHFFLERYQEAYLAEMSHFVWCLAENKTPVVGGYDGKVSVAMGYAALESLRRGTFIKLDLGGMKKP